MSDDGDDDAELLSQLICSQQTELEDGSQNIDSLEAILDAHAQQAILDAANQVDPIDAANRSFWSERDEVSIYISRVSTRPIGVAI
jgi:hypothetical protein